MENEAIAVNGNIKYCLYMFEFISSEQAKVSSLRIFMILIA